jgi:signal transduction histidine kinase
MKDAIRPSGGYLTIGLALGLGAPLGFVALRRLLATIGPKRWAGPFFSERAAFAYMSIATPLMFGVFGRLLGLREEKLHTQAAQIERLREEFAAVVAHDLRNPISAILLQLDVLIRQARGGSVPVPISTLRKLQCGGERLNQMVSDLLDAASIEASRLRIQPQALSVPDAVTTLVERIRPTLGSHPIEMQMPESRKDDPLVVSADPVRFDQILTNLLENAAKYSPPETPIVIHAGPEAGGAHISVEDRGPGLAPEDLPKLFDRFYQTARARQKKTGLGLGLYITKGLVEAQGGRLFVESEANQGSTFTVWLPAANGSVRERTRLRRR